MTPHGSGVVANGDICPSGWHLPYGGSGTGTKGGNTDGGFYYLNYKLNNNSNVTNGTASNLLRAYPNNFVYSGLYYGSSVTDRGSRGYYWSSTASSSSGGYSLYFSSSYVDPGTYSGSKYYGQAVRCLAEKPSYNVSISLTNPDGPSKFESVTVYDNYSTNEFDKHIGAGNIIGSFSSPEETINVTTNTGIIFIDIYRPHGLSGGTSSTSGGVTDITTAPWEAANTIYIYEVTGDGTITLDRIIWDD